MGELPKNHLPMFRNSNNLSDDFKNLIRTKAVAMGMYKSKFTKHMRNAGLISVLDGKEYFRAVNFDLDLKMNEINIEDTKTWNYFETLRLLGMDDENIAELLDAYGNDQVENIIQQWVAQEKSTIDKYKRQISELEKDIQDVFTVEVEYELQAYESISHPDPVFRIYNTRESLYGLELPWGSIFTISDTQYKLDNSDLSSTIESRHSNFTIGKNVVFRNSIGVDITENYTQEVITAVQALIAYSGTKFMDRTDSIKVSERIFTSGELTYYGITGRETYNATIKTEMLSDVDKYHWVRFSQDINGEENPTQIDNRVENSTQANYYTRRFWQYKRFVLPDVPLDSKWFSESKNAIVDVGDEHIVRVVGESGWVDVSEFRKLTETQAGDLLSKYFYFKIIEKKKNFFEKGLEVVLKGLGKIFNFAYKLLDAIPSFRLILASLTKLVNKIFGSDLSERDLFDLLLKIAITIIVTFFTIGTGTQLALMATSIAIDAAKAEREAEEQKDENERIKEQKEKEAEDEKRKETQEGTSEEREERENFEAFLKDPLHFENKKMKLKDDRQFKLL